MDKLYIITNECKFPCCECSIPDWAFSKEVRIKFCEVIEKRIREKALAKGKESEDKG